MSLGSVKTNGLEMKGTLHSVYGFSFNYGVIVTKGNPLAVGFKGGFHKNGKWDFSGIQPQVFAGLGFNLPKTQLTFSVCADVRSFFDKGNYTDFIWSGAFGLHFKL